MLSGMMAIDKRESERKGGKKSRAHQMHWAHYNISANQIKMPFKLWRRQCNAEKNMAKYVDNFMSFIAEK